MTDPTPATPDEAVARDFDRRQAIVDDTFPYTFGVTPPIVMHRRGRLMMRLVEFERETLSRQQGDTVAARDCACRKRHCVWGTSATSTTRILGDCMASADGFTADRIAAILMARPYVIGRARIQHAEAARIACDLWDALTEVPA